MKIAFSLAYTVVYQEQRVYRMIALRLVFIFEILLSFGISHEIDPNEDNQKIFNVSLYQKSLVIYYTEKRCKKW